jgi:hypothetical protein
MRPWVWIPGWYCVMVRVLMCREILKQEACATDAITAATLLRRKVPLAIAHWISSMQSHDPVARALAVELMVSVLQNPLHWAAPAPIVALNQFLPILTAPNASASTLDI